MRSKQPDKDRLSTAAKFHQSKPLITRSLYLIEHFDSDIVQDGDNEKKHDPVKQELANILMFGEEFVGLKDLFNQLFFVTTSTRLGISLNVLDSITVRK